ncbi:MAG: hypothetical protein ACQETI_00775, partial [Halobacteriota archaeon]
MRRIACIFLSVLLVTSGVVPTVAMGANGENSATDVESRDSILDEVFDQVQLADVESRPHDHGPGEDHTHGPARAAVSVDRDPVTDPRAQTHEIGRDLGSDHHGGEEVNAPERTPSVARGHDSKTVHEHAAGVAHGHDDPREQPPVSAGSESESTQDQRRDFHHFGEQRLVTQAAVTVEQSATRAAIEHVETYESDDIPNATVIESIEEIPANVTRNLSVSAPTTREADNQTVVTLYSWSQHQGLLLRWNVTVGAEYVLHREATVVALGVGAPVDYEEFAPPEGAVVIDEATAVAIESGLGGVQQAPNGQANISFSDNIVTIWPNGDAESTDISVSNFGDGNETVTVNISVDGNDIPDRSGNPLVIQTDEHGNGSVTFTPPGSIYTGRAKVVVSSPTQTETWEITDRTPGNDNFTHDDERGLLTIEHTISRAVTAGGHMTVFRVHYTDQNVDNGNSAGVVQEALDTAESTYRMQVGTWGFNRHEFAEHEPDNVVQIHINDGTWAYHRTRSTNAVMTSDWSRYINYNANIKSNATKHAKHIIGHEMMHHVQYTYAYSGGTSNTGGDWQWYLEGMARFSETQTDPTVINNSRSFFFANNINGVNGYLRNPNRDLRNFSYDYALFWLYLHENGGGFPVMEQFLEELKAGGNTSEVDGPAAISRALQKNGTGEYTTYEELVWDFHIDVYRAVEGSETGYFQSNGEDWSVYLSRSALSDPYVSPPYDSQEVESKTGSLKPWGVAYYELSPDDDTYIALNRSDFRVATIRYGPDENVVVRGNLSDRGTLPNDTVFGGRDHDQVGVVISPVGNAGGGYNLTVGSHDDHHIENGLETGESAVYVVPADVTVQSPSGNGG